MARRSVETNRRSLTQFFAGIDPLHVTAISLKLGFVHLEVVDRFGLERHVLDAVAIRGREDHRVVILLVPSLQEDLAVLASRLPKSEDFGVVGRAKLKVGSTDFNVPKPEDCHTVIVLQAQVVRKSDVPICGPACGTGHLRSKRRSLDVVELCVLTALGHELVVGAVFG